MKTTITIRRTLVIALSLAFLLTVSSLAVANDRGVDTFAVKLKHIGNIETQPVFQLNITNVELDDYLITISDEEGIVLYDDRVKGSNISRKFQLNTDEIEGNITFEVRSRRNKKIEVFKVNSRLRYVQETLVSKL